ncbi:helix-turn-helix transcriptional regulator [Alkalihalobacterium chitinilyticum]|uniref:Helix-turn-helix transcriptional regulator n=1 Tax=Alkalihalobacterium chitinilyticum TaxID=2980103 RepID=A0ABT5VKR0_9BACI|nr:helix-turn-helix transcriptional regulator [Alkalihalobacterium chitinilyticum]MDE5416033.1 helix-turn-helix transcriptional regulator [Alkalihalobacterium chitinilyticum]
MTKLSISVKKLGLSSKDILHIMILQSLNQTPSHPAEIYRQVSEALRNDHLSSTRSRTYVYKTIEELQQNGLIEFQKQGRKKVFSLSQEGTKYLKDHKVRVDPSLQKLIAIVEHMRETITKRKIQTVDISLTDDDKQYLSKLINVKALIQWYSLYRLIHEGNHHGGALYGEMNIWFGWMNNHGYFYQVLREMNQEGLINGTWLDEDTRSQRKYEVTDLGKRKFTSLSLNIERHFTEVHQFLRSMIEKLNHTP